MRALTALSLVACCASWSLVYLQPLLIATYQPSMLHAEMCVAGEGAHFGIFIFDIVLSSPISALWLVQGAPSEAKLRRLAAMLQHWSQGCLWCHIKSQR